MIQKIKKRLFEQENRNVLRRNLSWCQNVCQEFGILASQLDNHLWGESKKFEEDLYLRTKTILKKLDVDLGGGGYCSLLYFITRYFKPEVIVETGVAAGYSTQAFLKAMRLNNKGMLYSSDFPYFRLEKPEQYIGILVEENLKDRWNLYIKGDKKNLPEIAAQIPRIDIFHYDSDKTYSGRLFAMSIIERLLHRDSIIIMDDIQNNSFFYDYIKNRTCSGRVFRFLDKYIGSIGI
jgi:predicted O-methyltransferase YrrM